MESVGSVTQHAPCVMEEHRRSVLGARTITIESETHVSLYVQQVNMVTQPHQIIGSVQLVIRHVPLVTVPIRTNVTHVNQATIIVEIHVTNVALGVSYAQVQAQAIVNNVTSSINRQVISRLLDPPRA
jgi:hypothetical protein